MIGKVLVIGSTERSRQCVAVSMPPFSSSLFLKLHPFLSSSQPFYVVFSSRYEGANRTLHSTYTQYLRPPPFSAVERALIPNYLEVFFFLFLAKKHRIIVTNKNEVKQSGMKQDRIEKFTTLDNRVSSQPRMPAEIDHSLFTPLCLLFPNTHPSYRQKTQKVCNNDIT